MGSLAVVNHFLGFNPDEGNKYIQVFVSITNNGKSSDTFLPSYGFGNDVRVKLLYGDGYEYSSSVLLGYDNDLHDSHLNPLSSVDKEIAFSVPEKVSSSEEELLVEFSSGKTSVTFKIR